MAPGESTVVELIFKTRTYRTRISKYATIYSNDPGQSTAKIHLSANVFQSSDTTMPFKLQPEKASLSRDSKKGKIVLENRSDSKLRIESLDAIEGLKLDIKNDDPKPGQESELKFEWKEDFEKENVERSITLLAFGDGVDSTRFSVPVVLQGTDPAPAAEVRKPRRTTINRSAAQKAKTHRRVPRRVTTKAEDPKSVDPSGSQDSAVKTPSLDKTGDRTFEDPASKLQEDSEQDE